VASLWRNGLFWIASRTGVDEAKSEKVWLASLVNLKKNPLFSGTGGCLTRRDLCVDNFG
jgi:hypothetical protein